MTDNEIVKALECCAECVKAASCRKCPYRKLEGDCIVRLSRDALDFINRQKEEIEILQGDVDFFDKYNDELIEENEQLKTGVERLQHTLDEELGRQASLVELVKKQAKADAVKELAERLYAVSYPRPTSNGYVFVVNTSDVSAIADKIASG